jgi:hypothetical protein
MNQPSTTAPGSILALNGNTAGFSLCRSYITSAANGVTALLYNADPKTVPNANSYDGASCESVQVVIVPVEDA